MAERRALLGALLLALVAALAGCGDAATVTPLGEEGVHGNRLEGEARYVVPTTELRGTDGEAFALTDPETPLTLVFFGYTNCPDICQAVMSSLASAKVRLDESVRPDLGVVFVTTDPARDDEAALRRYLDRYDPEFAGATGEMDTIIEVAADLRVNVDHGDQMPSGGYEVNHGTYVLGVQDDRVSMVWNESTSSAEFAQDITTLLQEAR